MRFELTFFALNPKLAVVAPWREWDIKGREDAIEYAKKHSIPVTATKKSIYSRDRNLWHISHEVYCLSHCSHGEPQYKYSTMGSHLYVLGMCVLHYRLVNIWMQLDLKVLVVTILFPL